MRSGNEIINESADLLDGTVVSVVNEGPRQPLGLTRRPDADVRRILRLLRRPHLLEKERLAILLRQAVGANTAREALQAVVDQTFGPSYEAQRLREILQRCDVRGEKARTAAAAMHLSLRQFFRYRVEAVSAIAASIAARVNATPCTDHDLAFARMISSIDASAALGLYVSAVRSSDAPISEPALQDIVRCLVWAQESDEDDDLFCEDARLAIFASVERAGRALLMDCTAGRERVHEAQAALAQAHDTSQEGARFALTSYELLRARVEGNQALAASLVARLWMYSGSSESLHALALSEQAYQECLNGTLERAENLLSDAEKLSLLGGQLGVAARIALVKATTCYLGGKHSAALAYAKAALSALSGSQPAYAFLAAALSGRAALYLGKAWSVPEQLCVRFPHSSLRADLESLRSRHLLQKDPQAARRAALHALHLAQQHGARGSIAFARVSLAAVADAQHRASEARLLRSQALQQAVMLGDHLLLYDSMLTSAPMAQPIAPKTA